ncbi:MAG: 50S ribosomal protein L29 [Candidatus Gastranaerophilales bacterium]|jgi:large subunit ribosomal protein L29|nr:50S ribosomal protein L29 [Candidatus Gastranaerophilales bacterium]
MKINQIRELTIDELKDEVINLKKKLFELKIAKANHKLENPAEISGVKHQIAQVKTVIREKELTNN